MQKKLVSDFLSVGRENARPGKELCELLGVNKRNLEFMVFDERQDGKAICATTSKDNPGYYIARDAAELRSYCGSLYRRAGNIFKTRRACLKTLEKMEKEGDPANE